MQVSVENEPPEFGRWDRSIAFKQANPLIVAEKLQFGKHSLTELPFRTALVDFDRLYESRNGLMREISKFNHNCLIFSKNFVESMRIDRGPLLKSLRIGYSSFGGIDRNNVDDQTAQCLEDFLLKRQIDGWPDVLSVKEDDYEFGRGPGSFSLVVDDEQFGGSRFGLPRLLSVLGELQCPATFFFTNTIEDVYPGITEAVYRLGHEVGIHGLYHEFLDGRDFREQAESIAQMKGHIGVEVSGANFISRMDENTIRALVSNAMEYVVYPSIRNYFVGRFVEVDTLPRIVQSPEGGLVIMPIQVETYGRSSPVVRGMASSALRGGFTQGFPHIVVLVHPFRDGSLRRIHEFGSLLVYLKKGLGLTPLRMKTVARWVRDQKLPKEELPFSELVRRLFSTDRKVQLAGQSLSRKPWSQRIRFDPRNLIPRNLHEVTQSPVMALNNLRWLRANRTHTIDD